VTRAAFLKLFAVITQWLPDSKCITTKGYPRPCENKEGWEECPVGHYQQPVVLGELVGDIPLWNTRHQLLMHYDGPWFHHRACSVCGVAYVKL